MTEGATRTRVSSARSGWKEIVLGEVIELISGQHINAGDYNSDRKGFPYLTGPSDFGEQHPVVTRWTEFPKKSATRGDILLTVKGSGVGKTNVLDIDQAVISRQIMAVRAKQIDARYLALVMAANSGYFRSLATGAAIPGISREDVTSLRLTLPPSEEQKRIVAVLDQAFAALDRARAHAEANLADAEGLLTNALDMVFRDLATTHPVLRLEDAVHADCKLSYGIVQPGDEVEAGLPVVRPVDLKQRVITLDGLKRIVPDRAKGYARTMLVGDELLLCVRGSTGEIAMASPDLKGGNVTRGIVPVRFDGAKVNREFAYFQFLSRHVRDQIAAGTYGAALTQINIKDLRQLRFVVPDVSLQRETVARAERMYAGVQELRATYSRKLADLANLRQSLLQKAFSGELT